MAPRMFRRWRGNSASGGSCSIAGIVYIKVSGEAGLRSSGRPRQNLMLLSPDAAPPGPGVPGPVDALARAEARIAELEGKIGRQQLDLDFFRAALRHAGDEPPLSGVPGGTASSR